MLFKKFSVFLLILAGTFCCNNANAQLWSYIGWTPAKEKAFEKRLEKEAYKVITHYDADKFPNDEMIYRVRTLDSSVCYVHIMYVPFTGHYSVKCATDSLNIEDCKGVARLHFLRKDLFEIVYSPRGGSDDGFNNVLLLAIRNGKFRMAMDLQSMHDYGGPGFVGLDETHLFLKGNTQKDYQLTLKNHHLRRYNKKSKNFDHYHNNTLKYDNELNIFYTSHEQVNGYVYNDDWEKKQHVNGTFPVINFAGAKYCYTNGLWYEVGSDYKTNETSLFTHCYRPKAKD